MYMCEICDNAVMTLVRDVALVFVIVVQCMLHLYIKQGWILRCTCNESSCVAPQYPCTWVYCSSRSYLVIVQEHTGSLCCNQNQEIPGISLQL